MSTRRTATTPNGFEAAASAGVEPTDADVAPLAGAKLANTWQGRADDFRYLLAVARTGRLITAATMLKVDHTTVSRRITALEKSLGLRLLERGADGWELTAAGRAVAENATPIENALERIAEIAAGQSTSSLHGTVRLTAPDGFGTLFAPHALANLQKSNPHLRVELVTATRQLNLHQSGFDLAVAVGNPVSSRLVTEKLADHDLALFASETYLQERGVPSTLDELREHPLIFYIDSLLQVGDLDVERYLPGVTTVFGSSNVMAQLEATRAGVGVGLLPNFLAARYSELRRLDGIDPKMRLSYTLAARKESVSHPTVRAVRAALCKEVRLRQHELTIPDSDTPTSL